MRIALITPKRNLWSHNPKIRTALEGLQDFIQPWYTPNLGLLTLAALTPTESRFDYIDEQFEDIDFSKAYDIIAISVMTQQAHRAYVIGDKFREKGKFVIMGGMHPTLLPHEAIEHADAIIAGEAELLWPQFIKDFSSGNPKKMYRTDELAELKYSPTPRYDLLKEKYTRRRPEYFSMIPVQATRGCPHDCYYCVASNVFGKKYRIKEIQQIVDEISFIKECLPNYLILFADDNLFPNREFAHSLMEAITPLEIKWVCQSDISIGKSDELLKLIKKAGCVGMLIGLESLSVKTLERVNKSKWKSRYIVSYEKYIHNIQQKGIIVYAAFIFGFDGDNIGVFKETRDFMLRNNILGQFTILTPLPGTRLRDQLQKQERLLYPNQWDMYTFFDVTYKPTSISAKELEDNFVWLYQQIYNLDAHGRRLNHMKDIYKHLIKSQS